MQYVASKSKIKTFGLVENTKVKFRKKKKEFFYGFMALQLPSDLVIQTTEKKI